MNQWSQIAPSDPSKGTTYGRTPSFPRFSALSGVKSNFFPDVSTSQFHIEIPANDGRILEPKAQFDGVEPYLGIAPGAWKIVEISFAKHVA